MPETEDTVPIRVEKSVTCPSLRGEKITELRCRMKRKEDVKFWGDRSKQMIGCPCQRMGEDMAKVGKCNNCERPEAKMADKAEICFNCLRHAQNTKGEERVKKLAEAKALYGALMPGERLHMVPRVKKLERKAPKKKSLPPAAATPESAPPSTERKALPKNSILLVFGDRDHKLYQSIISDATKFRREPDQHILWMIEDMMPMPISSRPAGEQSL